MVNQGKKIKATIILSLLVIALILDYLKLITEWGPPRVVGAGTHTVGSRTHYIPDCIVKP
jgi:hypothetical protein